MSACQAVAGERVVESFGIEPDKFGILPVMFNVAAAAGLASYICR
jgi:hypothetical protein